MNITLVNQPFNVPSHSVEAKTAVSYLINIFAVDYLYCSGELNRFEMMTKVFNREKIIKHLKLFSVIAVCLSVLISSIVVGVLLHSLDFGVLGAALSIGSGILITIHAAAKIFEFSDLMEDFSKGQFLTHVLRAIKKRFKINVGSYFLYTEQELKIATQLLKDLSEINRRLTRNDGSFINRVREMISQDSTLKIESPNYTLSAFYKYVKIAQQALVHVQQKEEMAKEAVKVIMKDSQLQIPLNDLILDYL